MPHVTEHHLKAETIPLGFLPAHLSPASSGSEISKLRERDPDPILPLQRRRHSPGFLSILPILLAFVATAGTSSALLAWLLSRRVFPNPETDLVSKFHGA